MNQGTVPPRTRGRICLRPLRTGLAAVVSKPKAAGAQCRYGSDSSGQRNADACRHIDYNKHVETHRQTGGID